MISDLDMLQDFMLSLCKQIKVIDGMAVTKEAAEEIIIILQKLILVSSPPPPCSFTLCFLIFASSRNEVWARRMRATVFESNVPEKGFKSDFTSQTKAIKLSLTILTHF